MNKLSFVLNNTFYTKSEVKISDNESSYDYVKRVIVTIEEIHSAKLQMILFQQDNLVTYGYELPQKSGSTFENLFQTNVDDLKKITVTPQFDYMHFSDFESGKPYQEIDLLVIYDQMYEFLPINSETKVKLFLNFIINDLNINFHPDDKFSDYLDELGFLINSEGKKVFINYIAVEFMEALIETCFDICGDLFYEYGYEMLQANLAKDGIIIGVEKTKYSPNDNNKVAESIIESYCNEVGNNYNDLINNRALILEQINVFSDNEKIEFNSEDKVNLTDWIILLLRYKSEQDENPILIENAKNIAEFLVEEYVDENQNSINNLKIETTVDSLIDVYEEQYGFLNTEKHNTRKDLVVIEINKIVEQRMNQMYDSEGNPVSNLVYDEEKFASRREFNEKLITEYLGQKNTYTGSADWGGMDVWTVTSPDNGYKGIFVVIEDDGGVVLLRRDFDEKEGDNVDNTIATFDENDTESIEYMLIRMKNKAEYNGWELFDSEDDFIINKDDARQMMMANDVEPADFNDDAQISKSTEIAQIIWNEYEDDNDTDFILADGVKRENAITWYTKYVHPLDMEMTSLVNEALLNMIDMKKNENLYNVQEPALSQIANDIINQIPNTQDLKNPAYLTKEVERYCKVNNIYTSGGVAEKITEILNQVDIELNQPPHLVTLPQDQIIKNGDIVFVEAGKYIGDKAKVVGIGIKETGVDSGYKIQLEDGSFAIVFRTDLEKRTNIIPDELGESLCGFLSAWSNLSGMWTSVDSDDDIRTCLEANYPFIISFDDLEIYKWVTKVLEYSNIKWDFYNSPYNSVNIIGDLINFRNAFDKIINEFDFISANNEESRFIDNLVLECKEYPFTDKIDDVHESITEWTESAIKSLRKFIDEDVVEKKDVQEAPKTKDLKAEIIKFIEDNSWFQDESEMEEPNEIRFTTREYGNVGDEVPGQKDIDKAKELCRLVAEKYPNTQSDWQTVDEWTDLMVTILTDIDRIKSYIEKNTTYTINDSDENSLNAYSKFGFDVDLKDKISDANLILKNIVNNFPNIIGQVSTKDNRIININIIISDVEPAKL